MVSKTTTLPLGYEAILCLVGANGVEPLLIGYKPTLLTVRGRSHRILYGVFPSCHYAHCYTGISVDNLKPCVWSIIAFPNY